jgi:hypothetical protein
MLRDAVPANFVDVLYVALLWNEGDSVPDPAFVVVSSKETATTALAGLGPKQPVPTKAARAATCAAFVQVYM